MAILAMLEHGRDARGTAGEKLMLHPPSTFIAAKNFTSAKMG